MGELYKESSVAGTEYTRSRLVEIHNQQGVLPHISFLEERVTILPDRVLHTDIGSLRTNYAQDEEIELLDPSTQLPLGATMTQGQVMVAIYSLYMQLAKARDSANTQPSVEPVITEIPNV